MKLLPILLCAGIYIAGFSMFQQPALEKSVARGKELYKEMCISCHLGKGEGIKGAIPPLAGADYLLKTPNKAIASVKFGLKGPIVVNGIPYNSMMPDPGLTDEEIADVMNYILNSWGNKPGKPMITTKMVEAVKN